jgi:hypothetical protein
MSNAHRHGKTGNCLDEGKSDYLEVRLGPAEKQAFKNAAHVAGLALSASAWERLRQVARRELIEAGCLVPFLQQEAQHD